MTHPISPELLARIEAHERWVVTHKEEGQMLADGMGMDLSDVDLSGRILSSVTLPFAKFDRSVLRSARLNSSNYCGASFCEAVLDNAQIVKTDASRADFSKASLRNVRGVRLEVVKTNFQRANLSDSNFYDADFTQANLEYANFGQADLREVAFYKANMAYAILTGASFWGAELAGATGLELAEIEWIDIGNTEWVNGGERNDPHRLDGEEARRWLFAEAAKPLPKFMTRRADDTLNPT
ncbi:MAG: pentapeptide repeat-containing protein [Ktedonobacteraceae bacterium]